MYSNKNNGLQGLNGYNNDISGQNTIQNNSSNVNTANSKSSLRFIDILFDLIIDEAIDILDLIVSKFWILLIGATILGYIFLKK